MLFVANLLPQIFTEESIEEMIEPYLIQIGFLNRTPRGRIVTDAAYRHFGFTPPVMQEAQALAS